MASKSFEWTFIKKPLRKYEQPEGQDTPVKRPLSVANVPLDALDLFFNHRGIGWSWSSHPFPQRSTHPPSITSVLAKTLLEFTLLDATQYVLHLMSSSVDKTGSGSLINTGLPFLLHRFSALLATFFGAVWAYAQIDLMYHVAMLIGRILLRQPATLWPPFFHRPWMATSVRDFWSVRWHQFFRHFFIVFGARPGGALLGQPGATMGAFFVSGLIHIVGPVWATGRVTEFLHKGDFFLLMDLGVSLECGFERATGLPVRGWLGWLWTMGWMLSWGPLVVGSLGRGGIFAIELFPDHLRPGKMFVNGAISLFCMCK
jgi:hypothetical protein